MYHLTFCTNCATQILCDKHNCLPGQHVCYTCLARQEITLPLCAGSLEMSATTSTTLV
jgi:hypothetical protein